MPSIVSYLLNGPIFTTPERRQDALEQMAHDLIEAGPEALKSDEEACRALFGNYAAIDVLRLAGEARYLACQEIVGQEMSEP